MEIYLIRHPKVNLTQDICYGQSDIGVADSFAVESKTIKDKLPELKDFICYSSPLSRCKILAEYLFEDQFQIDSRLLELNFGEWERKTWDEIGKEAFDKWHRDFVYNKIPGGESYFELSSRIISFWEEMKISTQNTILITHGGVIRALLSHIAGLPLENSFRFKIDFGGITKISLSENQIHIEYVNR